jgi:hypothetical protein
METNQSLYLELLRLVDQIYIWSVSLGGVLAFGIIVYSGILWIVSAGNQEKIKDARDRIVQATFGLGLLLLAVVILNSIPGIAQIDSVDPPTATIKKLMPVSQLRAEEHDTIRKEVEKSLDDTDGSIESYKQIFANLKIQYEAGQGKYNTRFNSSLYSFFKKAQNEGKDKAIFESLTTQEKADYIRLRHFADIYAKNQGIGTVDMVDLAKELNLAQISTLYNELSVGGQSIYEDQKYFINNLRRDQLVGFLESLDHLQRARGGYAPGSIETDLVFRLISQLNDVRVISLYDGASAATKLLVVRQLVCLERVDLARTLYGPRLPACR